MSKKQFKFAGKEPTIPGNTHIEVCVAVSVRAFGIARSLSNEALKTGSAVQAHAPHHQLFIHDGGLGGPTSCTP